MEGSAPSAPARGTAASRARRKPRDGATARGTAAAASSRAAPLRRSIQFGSGGSDAMVTEEEVPDLGSGQLEFTAGLSGVEGDEGEYQQPRGGPVHPPVPPAMAEDYGGAGAYNLFDGMPQQETFDLNEGYMMNMINNNQASPVMDMANQNSPMGDPTPTSGRGQAKRGSSYTIKEDKLLCTAWLEVSQDPILGAEQRGKDYWRRVHEYFHEFKNYTPWNFTSDRNEKSLSHRWATIQELCNKFCGAYEQINNRPRASGIGIKHHVDSALELYLGNEKKAFGLLHCWTVLSKAPKWMDLVASLKKNGGASKKKEKQ